MLCHGRKMRQSFIRIMAEHPHTTSPSKPEAMWLFSDLQVSPHGRESGRERPLPFRLSACASFCRAWSCFRSWIASCPFCPSDGGLVTSEVSTSKRLPDVLYARFDERCATLHTCMNKQVCHVAQDVMRMKTALRRCLLARSLSAASPCPRAWPEDTTPPPDE